MTERILERIQRCKFCGREMNCSPLSYAENPLCTICLPERTEIARPKARITWRTEGHYAIAEVARTPRPSERKRHRA
jgi:hypothetical protein